MIKKYFSAVLLPLIIAGCGSSSSKSIYIGKGEYLDSAVWGVSYECGNEKGITNEKGEFYYEMGKECQFYLGNYPFKKVSGDDLKSSKTKVFEKDVRVARFLQILDNDGDASNGITITKNVISKIPVDAYEFNDEGMSKLYSALKDDTNYSGRMVTKKEAQDHIEETIALETSTLYAIVHTSNKTINQGDSITFDASDSTGVIESYTWKDGTTRIGSGKNFTTSNLSIGNHTITLEIKDKSGKVDKKTVNITVLAPKTEWDLATEVASSGKNRLLVRTDDNNIYLKFQADPSISRTSISKAQFYINSDDSEVSGLSTSTIGRGLDYRIDNEGVYHLMDSEDFNGIKVQDTVAVVTNKSLIVTIDQDNIEYLAQNISFGLRLDDENLSMKSTQKYTIPNYTKPTSSNVKPIVTIKGEKFITLDSNESFVDEGATAYDIVDKENLDVTVDKSDLDEAKEGYYTVFYTATNGNGKKGVASRIIYVKGTPSQSELEIKDMGSLKESVSIDHQHNLVWANDDTSSVNDQSTRGCFVIGEGTTDLATKLENYCTNSNYAGFTDWRVPTDIEISRFTVRMKQEGKTPGMARHHCLRTLGIDSTSTVKAINTHITDLPGLIRSDVLTPAGGRCVRGIENNDIGSFIMKVKDGGKIIIDSAKSLTWVNEYDANKNACLAIHVGNEDQLNESKEFCKKLDYANYTNWRTPTSAELSNFVKKTNEVHILPGYEATCTRLLAKDDDNVSKAVYTRFDHNASHILGGVVDLEENLTSNIGLRCVRDN